jgi:hypothetical protein
MLDRWLSNLIAIHEAVTDPAIPDAIERAGEQIADLAAGLADLVRTLQGRVTFAAGPDDPDKAAACLAKISEIEKALKPKAARGKGRPKKVSATAAAAIDPATLLMLLQLARQLLDLWRKRREAA